MIGRGRKVTILCYHDPEPLALSRQLAALSRHYRFTSLRDYVAARRSGDMGGLPKRALVITLDDGHRGNFRLLEVFRQHEVVPTIFLASGIVGTNRGFWWTQVPGGSSETELLKAATDAERVAALSSFGHSETDDLSVRSALSRDEIEAMRGTVDFQSHTVLHPILSRCTDERAWVEIAQSKADLESGYGLGVYALSYPNGTPADFGDREVALARRAGYECALSAVAGLADSRSDPYRIPRIVVPDDAGADEVLVRASLLHAWLKRLVSATRG